MVEHLYLLRCSHSEFGADFDVWFNSDSIKESEESWELLKEKYDLGNNNWLMSMYEKRMHWVPAYWKDVFTAGMRSSQRSESINSFFDGFVNAMTPLDEFVIQYNKALASRRKVEKSEDNVTLSTKAKFDFDLEIERQAAKCYTRNLYELFHRELSSSVSYFKGDVVKDGCRRHYKIGRSTVLNEKWRTVLYDVSDGVSLSCSCALFETVGMLCRHILCLMRFKSITLIPDRYLLRRWTIDARYRGLSESCSSDDVVFNVTPLRAFSVRSKMNKVFEHALCSSDGFKRFDCWLDGELEKYNENEQVVCESVLESDVRKGGEENCAISVRDPVVSRRGKGRPENISRFQSGREVAVENKAKKQRTCGYCNGLGHYRTGCPVLKSIGSSKRSDCKGKDVTD